MSDNTTTVYGDCKDVFLQGLRDGNPLGNGWAEFSARMDASTAHLVQVSTSLQAISNRPAEIRTAMSHELAQALSQGDEPFIWTLRGLAKGYALAQGEKADTLMSGVRSLYDSLKTAVKHAEESHTSRMVQERQIKDKLNAALAKINGIHPTLPRNKVGNTYMKYIKGDGSYFNGEGILTIKGEVFNYSTCINDSLREWFTMNTTLKIKLAIVNTSKDKLNDIVARIPMLFRIMKSSDKRLKAETFNLYVHQLGKDKYIWKYTKKNQV